MLQTLEGPSPIPSSPRPATSELAEITPVPAKEAHRVLTPLHIWIAAGLTLLPIPVGLVGGFGGRGLGAYLSDPNGARAGVCAIAGLLCGGLCVFVLVRLQQLLPSRYLRFVARSALGRRANPLVRPNNQSAEFVDFVPRSHWGKKMLETATDIGFFKIDQARRELLMEGDAKRYRIPFSSVTSCEVEEFCLDGDEWQTELHYVTVLQVETATGSREIPLAGRHLTCRIRHAAQRRQQAYELYDRISAALGS
ncbi:MAG: hypothetical protein HY000_07350 [Planctomycetes bacterium]|nr:hypothetical protein [Planctomycetota bacterium]